MSTAVQPEPALLTLRQAASYLGRSEKTLYDFYRMGTLPGALSTDKALRRRGGGPVLVFRVEDLDAYAKRAQERRDRPALPVAERKRRYLERLKLARQALDQ